MNYEKKERNLSIVNEYRTNPNATTRSLAEKYNINKKAIWLILARYIDWEERYEIGLIKKSYAQLKRFNVHPKRLGVSKKVKAEND
jgi:hypothetical protein